MSFLPPVSSIALKEWAVAVNALSQGRQIMLLRKGGIHRDDKDFRIVHPEFLLFPTYTHQLPELLKDQYHPQLAESLEQDDVDGLVTISAWAEVTDIVEIWDEEPLARVSPHHIWSDDYAQKRLHWRPRHPLMVALVRVYRLRQPQALPVLDAYEGCKSWVDLGQDVPLGQMEPVLPEAEYKAAADAIKRALGDGPV
jgi:hypothetical protein